MEYFTRSGKAQDFSFYLDPSCCNISLNILHHHGRHHQEPPWPDVGIGHWVLSLPTSKNALESSDSGKRKRYENPRSSFPSSIWSFLYIFSLRLKQQVFDPFYDTKSLISHAIVPSEFFLPMSLDWLQYKFIGFEWFWCSSCQTPILDSFMLRNSISTISTMWNPHPCRFQRKHSTWKVEAWETKSNIYIHYTFRPTAINTQRSQSNGAVVM